MVKKIIKEVFIVALLGVAIVLVLGVLFYDYIPSSKVVPSKVEAYTTPQDIRNELSASSSIDNTPVVVTYELDERDLNLYQKTNEYVKGKVNPFAPAPTPTDNTTGDGNTTGGNTAGGNTTNQNNSKNPGSSTGTFYNNTGLK